MSLRYLAVVGACSLFAACAPIQPEHIASNSTGRITAATPAFGALAAPAPAPTPLTTNTPFDSAAIEFHRIDGAVESGHASWYGRQFEGRRTASGERYTGNALTAAHRTLPLGSYARITLLATSKSVVVRINDRGPFVKGRVIDLSYAAASSLGLTHAASTQVRIERVRNADVQAVVDESTR
jgi:rare lipoprotein A